VCDPLGITASGIEVIRRQEEAGIKKSLQRLAELIREYAPERIVLGYPKNLDGTEGTRCAKTLEFKARLERSFGQVPVVLWDERFSTVSAEAALREGGLNRDEIKRSVDKMAAVFILQNYLDYMKRGEDMTFDDFDEQEDELDEDIDTVVMLDDDGNETVFVILDGAEYNGATYLLVVEETEDGEEGEESEASILKEVRQEGEEAVYEFVDDEAEFNMAAQLFRSSGDDYVIQ
jgi:putative Holliday junction resolvase